MNIHSILSTVQKTLNAPKTQTNSFGGYKYRSCEDIQAAVKPLLPEGVTLVVSDDIVLTGDRVYVKATATISNGQESVSATAFAREALTKKGMDDSQITGSTSSYARKYALNGLLLIDDTKDADATNEHDKQPRQQPAQNRQSAPANDAAETDGDISALASAQTVPDLVRAMNGLSAEQKRAAKPTFDQRMKELKKAA